MTSPFRMLVIADVAGGTRRHIGDESMFEANLDGFRQRIPNIVFTVVTCDPGAVAARYGVDTVAPLGFSRESAAAAERSEMLDSVLDDARNGRRAIPLVDAMAAADALLVSGGGNLSSSWPEQIYERVALIGIAGIFGKPVIVLGQTLGPRFRTDERLLIAKALRSVRFLGLRELPSAALAMELGVPVERLWYQIDDACLPDSEIHNVTMPARTGKLRIAVTLDPQIRASPINLFEPLVDQLRQLALGTGASLLLIPHAFGDESANAPSDLTEARILAERLGLAQTDIAAGLSAGEARQLTGDSALVISSRYHPIVFGLSAGVAALGIHGDEYCRIKLQGALAHAGLDRCMLSYADVAKGHLLDKALALWSSRDELRRDIEACRTAWSEEYRERWDAVLHALKSTESFLPAGKGSLFGRQLEAVAPVLLRTLQARQRAWECEVEYSENLSKDLSARCEQAERCARDLERELGLRQTIKRYKGALLGRIREKFR